MGYETTHSAHPYHQKQRPAYLSGVSSKWLRLGSIVVTWVICFCTESANAQRFIGIDHHQRLKRYRFYEGDEIRLRLKEESQMRRLTLQRVLADSMWVVTPYEQRLKLAYASVSRVQIRAQTPSARFWSGVGTGLVPAGILVAGVSTFNQVGPNGEDATTASYIASGVAVVGGYLLTRWLNPRLQLGRKWTLKVLDLGPNVAPRRKPAP